MENYIVVNQCLFVLMPKELDHHLTDQIRKEIDGYFITHPIRHVAFDFSKTEFIDSSGIGLIMGRYEKLHVAGGKIFVLGMLPAIRRVLTMSGIMKLVYIKESERDVLTSVQ